MKQNSPRKTDTGGPSYIKYPGKPTKWGFTHGCQRLGAGHEVCWPVCMKHQLHKGTHWSDPLHEAMPADIASKCVETAPAGCSYQSHRVMVDLDLQLDKIWNHLRDGPLGVHVREINREGRPTH